MIFKQWEQVLAGTKTQARRLVKSGWDKPLPKTFHHSYYGDVEYRDVLMSYDACLFYEERGLPFPGLGVYREWTIHYPGELGGRGDVDTFYQAKWIIGRSYAIQPGRGKPAIWWRPDGTATSTPLDEYVQKASGIRTSWGPKVKRWLRKHGYTEVRIRITEIRRERLQDISHEDIEAEGIPKSLCMYYDDEGYKDFDNAEHRFLFEELWDGIHRKPGTRWADNPEVFALTFELERKRNAASTD